MVTKLDHLARSLPDARDIADELTRSRRQNFTDSQICNAVQLIRAGEPASQVARDVGMSRATLYRRMRNMDAASQQGAGG